VSDLAGGLVALETRFPVPAGPNEWRTTVTPTVVQAGVGSRNQVPPFATLTLDIRYAADETPATITTAVAACFPTAEVHVSEGGPGLHTDPAHPEVRRVTAALTSRLGRAPRLYREHFATDARYYTSVGIPAICVGPIGAGLHSDEEWVNIDSMVDLYHMLMDYIT
jgi:succinyl-diaminopimelate desuccinylase